jgi:hypothetical protein
LNSTQDCGETHLSSSLAQIYEVGARSMSHGMGM